MVKLYDSAFATCPRKARLAFEEKGAPYTRETLNPLVWTRDPSHPLRKVSPDGLLPLVEIDGKFLRESTVICEYVDEAFDGPALMPVLTIALFWLALTFSAHAAGALIPAVLIVLMTMQLAGRVRCGLDHRPPDQPPPPGGGPEAR